VDYLAANAYLDAYAHQRSAAGHRTVAVNWDAWRDVGMGVDTPVPEELAEQKRRKLAGGIPTASGIDAFARVLHSVLPQVVVSARAPAQWIAAEVGPQPVSLRAAADPGAAGPPRSGHVRSRSLPSAYLAPRDEVERQVAAVWEELFGIEGIGVDDRFFDLGGHSLLAIRIVARLKADLHAELSLNEFFETPTVAGIAALVRRSNSGASLDDMVAGLSDKEVERLLAEKSGPVTS
jgi:acyl carrier protein